MGRCDDKKFMKMLTLISMLVLIACGKNDFATKKITKQNVSALYSISSLQVFVYYEPGAEPYVKDALPFQYWTILQQNLAALYQGKLPASSILVPMDLSQMTKIAAQSKSLWSTQDVLNLSKTFGKTSTGTFTIIYLNGYSDQGQGIIGFQITGTNVIAVFKDVVRSVGPEESLVTRYIEQATLVHEMGHALGLVNNGLPLLSAHHDVANGAHCSVKDCVMSFSNEGRSSMIAYVNDIISNGTIIMYDQKCLNDAQSYKPK
jgi:predicted Zn-dependent protease